MTDQTGLTVVLLSQNERVRALRQQAEESVDAAQRTSDALDVLETELFGAPLDPSRPPHIRPSRPRHESNPPPPLSELRTRAEAHLRAVDIDPTGVSLDDLLDAEEIARIERRFSADFSLHAELDTADVIVSIAAGLTAALLDFLLVGIPKKTEWWGGSGPIKESPLTRRLRDLATDSDNPLSRWAKVSYDRVGGLSVPVDGLSGRTHRVQTFGHDPLLGLVFGVRDIMQGTMTAIPRGGGFIRQQIGEGEMNPFIALAKQIVHLLSDAITKEGLPLPGWTALASLGGPTFGPPVTGGTLLGPQQAETIGAIARRMYINGYDSWHFLTMATSALSVEVILRCYWGIRSALDPDWKEQIDIEAERNGTSGVSSHPRFASISLAAHGIAAAGNVIKFGVSGGNPLTLNVPQGLAFLRSFFRWANQRTGSLADRIDRNIRANARAAEAGWGQLDFNDPEFRSIAAQLTSPASNR